MQSRNADEFPQLQDPAKYIASFNIIRFILPILTICGVFDPPLYKSCTSICDDHYRVLTLKCSTSFKIVLVSRGSYIRSVFHLICQLHLNQIHGVFCDDPILFTICFLIPCYSSFFYLFIIVPQLFARNEWRSGIACEIA